MIEMLIAIGLLGMIALVITLFAVDIFKSQFYLGDSLEVEEEVEQALGRMTPEIRSITNSSNGSYAIVSVSSSSFSFYSNIDSDSLIEKVRYFLDGATFKKGVIEPSINPIIYNPASEVITVLAEDIISDDIFYFYDKTYEGSSGSPLEQPVKIPVIKSVKISLISDKNINLPPSPVSIETFINIRSLKL